MAAGLSATPLEIGIAQLEIGDGELRVDLDRLLQGFAGLIKSQLPRYSDPLR